MESTYLRVTAEQFAAGYLARDEAGAVVRKPYTAVRTHPDGTVTVVAPGSPPGDFDADLAALLRRR